MTSKRKLSEIINSMRNDPNFRSLPSSGRISASDINTALTRPATSKLSLNDPMARRLAGKPHGIIKYSDFYGKTFEPFLGELIFHEGSHTGIVLDPLCVRIEIVVALSGGGGGGGGGLRWWSGGDLRQAGAGGGGGGAGALIRNQNIYVAVNSIIDIHVGSGGAGGIGGNRHSSLAANGNAGGTTSIYDVTNQSAHKALLTLNGGGGGAGGNSNGWTGGIGGADGLGGIGGGGGPGIPAGGTSIGGNGGANGSGGGGSGGKWESGGYFTNVHGGQGGGGGGVGGFYNGDRDMRSGGAGGGGGRSPLHNGNGGQGGCRSDWKADPYRMYSTAATGLGNGGGGGAPNGYDITPETGDGRSGTGGYIHVKMYAM